jgi:hypothetical protein
MLLFQSWKSTTLGNAWRVFEAVGAHLREPTFRDTETEGDALRMTGWIKSARS